MDLTRKIKIANRMSVATASMSVVGSLLLLTTLARIDRTKRWSVYHRLMFSISIFDLVLSLAWCTGRLPIPPETGLDGAHGSTAACSAQGFFKQLGSATFAYSACLVVYYVMVIRYNATEEKIAKFCEPVMHAISIGFFLATAIAGLVLQLFNPGFSGCVVAGYPMGCDSSSERPCTRGGSDTTINAARLWFRTIPAFVIFVVLLSGITVVSYTVWKKNQQTRKLSCYVRHGSGSGGGNGSFNLNSTSIHLSATTRTNTNASANAARRPTAFERQSRQVQIQCFLFALSFINSILWGTVLNILLLHDNAADTNLVLDQFWVYIMTATLYPLQGFWNFLIFIRPRYNSYRLRELENPSGRWLVAAALWSAVWSPSSSSEKANATATPDTFSDNNNNAGPDGTTHTPSQKLSPLVEQSITPATGSIII